MLWTRDTDGLIEMQGREVYKRAVAEMSASVSEVARSTGTDLDDIDLIVAHQANARILTAVAERLGLPAERFATNIAQVGNTSAASIPLALGAALDEGRIDDGATVMVTAFGAGFTWGAGLVRWVPTAAAEESLRKVTVNV
jgi:3-oxoacyl-[acyl-carrier-protein] synthase-3